MILAVRIIVLAIALGACALLRLLPMEALLAIVALFMPVFQTITNDCLHCTGGDPVDTQVDIAGLTNLNCSSCASLNATYIVPGPIVKGGGDCAVGLSLSGSACGAYELDIGWQATGQRTTAALYYCGRDISDPVDGFINEEGHAVGCRGFSGYVLNLDYHIPGTSCGFGTEPCNPSLATVALTAI